MICKRGGYRSGYRRIAMTYLPMAIDGKVVRGSHGAAAGQSPLHFQFIALFGVWHVVKLMNEKLSDLRRDLHRELTDNQHRQVLKGTRSRLARDSQCGVFSGTSF